MGVDSTNPVSAGDYVLATQYDVVFDSTIFLHTNILRVSGDSGLVLGKAATLQIEDANISAAGSLTFNSVDNYDHFPAGTRMLFQQTAAPTGWTKETGAAYSTAVIMGTTGGVGSGGSTNIRTHNHTQVGHNHTMVGTGSVLDASGAAIAITGTSIVVSAGAGSDAQAGTVVDTKTPSINNASNIKYYDVIVAAKD